MAVQCTGKVGHDHDGTLEHTDKKDVAALVVCINLRGQFGYTRLDLFLGIKNMLKIGLDVL